MLWGCGLAGRRQGAQPWDLPLRELEEGLGGTSHVILSQNIQSYPLLETDGIILKMAPKIPLSCLFNQTRLQILL